MQSSQHPPEATNVFHDGHNPLESLIYLLKVKEEEAETLKKQSEQLVKQNEQLRIKLSEYREKEDSLQDVPSYHKSHLLRAKSDPIPRQSRSNNSDAEIFVFPDNNNPAQQQSQPQLPLLSPPLSNLSKHMEPENNMQPKHQQGSLCLSKVDLETETEPETSLNLRSNIPTSWLDPSLAPQGCTGVSELYFKNVLNELVKTKKYLNNLLTHQNQHPDKTVEVNNLRGEVQQLIVGKKYIENQMECLKEENAKLKAKVANSTRLARVDDSFELDNKVMCVSGTQTDQHLDMMQLDNKVTCVGSTQTDRHFDIMQQMQKLYNEVKKLELEKQKLMEEYRYSMENLMKENHGLKRDYKTCSTQVMSFSTLLQEEQVKNKSLDESLRQKTSEAQTLSERLGTLRSNYEELRGEKTALEKNLALQGGSRGRHRSQPQSIPSPGAAPHPHTDRFLSQDKPRNVPVNYGTDSPRLPYPGAFPSPADSRTKQLPGAPGAIPKQIQRRPQPVQEFQFNNLSQDERKPSNIPHTIQVGIPPGVLGAEAGFQEECPTCLQTFTVESAFQKHLEKCIE